MTEVFEYLQSRSAIPIQDAPIDHLFETLNEWNERPNGTIMPPSPGVQAYTLTYEYSDSTFRYSLDVEWREITKWLAKNVEPWQITHRSRSAVAALSPLRVYEQQKKIRNLMEWRNNMARHSLSSPESEHIYQMLFSRVVESLQFDKNYIVKYARDRLRSSLGEGFKWKQALQMPMEEWEAWFQIVKANAEDILANPGKFTNIRWNTGLRARANPIDGFRDKYVDEIDRTRIIQFHPYLSPWNAFLPTKKDLFGKVLQEMEEFLQVQGIFHYPYVEGGDIYLKASELFNAGYNFKAIDGKSWEASVGTLMGPAFSTVMMNLKGINLLPSGGFHTSIVGTMANVVQNRDRGGEMIVLGDDMNYFYKGRPHEIKAPWLEEDPGDSEHRFILGAAFNPDPNRPRISGFKVMSDRARKAIPFSFAEGQGQQAVVGKRSAQEVSTWAGMYLGWYGDDSLLNQLRKVNLKERDYFSPTEIMEELIESDINFEPFAWAERLGVKNLVVV